MPILFANTQACLKVKSHKKHSIFFSSYLCIGDSKTDPKSNSDIIREFEELKKNSQLNLRRLKKEKRYRRKLQEQLEIETKRRVQMEEIGQNHIPKWFIKENNANWTFNGNYWDQRQEPGFSNLDLIELW